MSVTRAAPTDNKAQLIEINRHVHQSGGATSLRIRIGKPVAPIDQHQHIHILANSFYRGQETQPARIRFGIGNDQIEHLPLFRKRSHCGRNVGSESESAFFASKSQLNGFGNGALLLNKQNIWVSHGSLV